MSVVREKNYLFLSDLTLLFQTLSCGLAELEYNFSEIEVVGLSDAICTFLVLSGNIKTGFLVQQVHHCLAKKLIR